VAATGPLCATSVERSLLLCKRIACCLTFRVAHWRGNAFSGLTAAPVFTWISRWPRSMAQYTVGHAARWKEIESRAAALGGLYLAGNGYTGIGIPDCIRMGRAAGVDLVSARSRGSAE
jgi:hypothetical protein